MSLSQLDLQWETLGWTWAFGAIVVFATFNMPMDLDSLSANNTFQFWWDGLSIAALSSQWLLGETLQIGVVEGIPKPAWVDMRFTNDGGLRELKRGRPVPSFLRTRIPEIP